MTLYSFCPRSFSRTPLSHGQKSHDHRGPRNRGPTVLSSYPKRVAAPLFAFSISKRKKDAGLGQKVVIRLGIQKAYESTDGMTSAVASQRHSSIAQTEAFSSSTTSFGQAILLSTFVSIAYGAACVQQEIFERRDRNRKSNFPTSVFFWHGSGRPKNSFRHVELRTRRDSTIFFPDASSAEK